MRCLITAVGSPPIYQTQRYTHDNSMIVSDPSGILVEFDTSKSAEASVSGTTLTFYRPDYILGFDPGVRYYILMDPGAVVGLLSCSGGGAPFRGISDPNEWSIETGKILYSLIF